MPSSSIVYIVVGEPITRKDEGHLTKPFSRPEDAGSGSRARRTYGHCGVAVLALLISTGCVSAARDAPYTPCRPDSARVAFLKQGWHSGLVLPATEARGSLAPLRQQFPGAHYLLIGWGERWFYPAAHPGLLAALRALFPAPSVLYVQGLRHAPPSPDLLWRNLPAGGLRGLQRFLVHAFRRTATGELEPLSRKTGQGGSFFRARGAYDALHTCNTWTITALKHAGLPLDPAGILFSGQALAAVRSIHPCPPLYPRRNGAAGPGPS